MHQEKLIEFSKMRACSLELSCKKHSIEYALNNGLIDNCAAYKSEANVMTSEFLQVELDEKTQVICKNIGKIKGKQDFREFETSKGMFVSEDYSDFGGKLTFPDKRSLRGNFVEVFEFKKSIYAISWLYHLFSSEMKIYKFSMNLKANKDQVLYESLDKWGADENIAYKAIYKTDDVVYILASGIIRKYDEEKSEDISFLFEIRKNSFSKKSFDFFISGRVNNMLVKDNKVYLGMNKIVAVIDVDLKEITAYTNISEEDEIDLMLCE